MSLEAARELSIPNLLRLLNDKLNLECTRLRETPPARVVPASTVESEVRAPWPIYVNEHRVLQLIQIKSLETTAREILTLIPTLRNSLNSLQPVNKLPPELLSHIAQYLLLDENTVNAKPVIPLTQVCRYWRESIISAPGLWTSISNSRSELMALSLERAKTSRLDVSIDMYPVFRTDPGSFGLTTPYLQNIDALRARDLPGIEELTRVIPDFPQSTPNLRSLTLDCAYTNAKWDPTIDPFGSLARTLKYLSLFNVPIYPSILSLRALTDLTLRYHWFDAHVDALLTFLEQNRSLERATLDIRFTGPSLRQSRRQIAIQNRLQHLSIPCNNPMNAQALISNIALRRGAHLEISSLDQNTGLNDILSDISTSHLSNLPSPTFLEYRSYPRNIRLHGRHGGFSFSCSPYSGIPFVEFPLLPLTAVREFRFEHHTPGRLRSSLSPPVFDPSLFPSLETLAVECDTDVLHFLSALLPNPSALPSLKTLAFLNCVITEDFMEKLTKYAYDRGDTTLARLYQIVIVQKDGGFPSAASIHALGRRVPVVDVRFGTKLPMDLT